MADENARNVRFVDTTVAPYFLGRKEETVAGSYTLDKFTKHDETKLRFTLIPPDELTEVLKVFEFGAKKYGDFNWRKCSPTEQHRYWDAAMRHMLAFRRDEMKDAESNYSHLAHAICSLFILLALHNSIQPITSSDKAAPK